MRLGKAIATGYAVEAADEQAPEAAPETTAMPEVTAGTPESSEVRAGATEQETADRVAAAASR